MKKLVAIAMTILCAINAIAVGQRNILTSLVSKEELKQMLLLNQEWVKLPSYYDRDGWEAFLGDSRDTYIKRGEKALNHTWPRVKATDYLEFERSGNRIVMETPLNDNNNAVANLLMAELAEGKGRFIDQLINGVYAAAEMTSWALSAHIPAY
ncbi:MAG: heparinase, partial [Duncaniella dubosii]|nr:heparinase [Duncaniella dubosii]